MDPVETIKSHIFLTGSTDAKSRIGNHRNSVCFPLVPTEYCNLGFVVGNEGLAIAYGCGHTNESLRSQNSVWCSFIEEGGYTDVPMRVLNQYHKVENSSDCLNDTDYTPNDPSYFHHGNELYKTTGSPIQGGHGSAVLMQCSDPHRYSLKAPIVSSKEPEVGQTVISLGVNRGTFYYSKGKVRLLDSDHNIYVDFDCYHGWCGAPLFSEDGSLLYGFGASINFTEDRNSDGSNIRRYGLSSYLSVWHMLNTMYSQESLPPWIDLNNLVKGG